MFQVDELIRIRDGVGNFRPLIEHAPVADDDDARGLAHLIERDDFRGELGTDAAGIAHGERNDGFFQVHLLRAAPSAELRW